MYEERKGLFGIKHTVDVTPIEQATPEQLDKQIKYWDEDRNAATAIIATGLAITFGGLIGVATGEIKLPDNDKIREALIVANGGVTLVEAGFVVGWGAFREYGQRVASEAQRRGLQVTNGRFVRSVVSPTPNTQ